MAMLECYQPSLIAWRILSRTADAFMIVEDQDAISVMRRLANPRDADPAVVSGESGGVGLAGLLKVASDQGMRDNVALGRDARVLLINTEGATDAQLYEELVGMSPAQVSLTSKIAELIRRESARCEVGIQRANQPSVPVGVQQLCEPQAPVRFEGPVFEVY